MSRSVLTPKPPCSKALIAAAFAGGCDVGRLLTIGALIPGKFDGSVSRSVPTPLKMNLASSVCACVIWSKEAERPHSPCLPIEPPISRVGTPRLKPHAFA
jgi:hypothetical protein